jgi:hypothetical protein
MNNEIYNRTFVREQFARVPREEIEADVALFALVEQLNPEVVITLPQFPELAYLRVQQRIVDGYGISRRLVQEETGFYYDRQDKVLIDLEQRDDGNIMPTSLAFSKKMLLYRRHGIAPFNKG